RAPCPRSPASLEVVPQRLRTAGVTQLRHGLRLDLTDPLTGHTEGVADLVQRLGLTVAETETHPDDTGLTLGERIQQLLELTLQHREADGVRRDDGLGVLDEVTEVAVAVLAERGVQRDRLTTVLLHLDDLLRRHVELAAELLRRGLAAQVLQHLTLHTGELVDALDDVHRDADRAGLVGHRAGDRLTAPPGGVSGELEALG